MTSLYDLLQFIHVTAAIVWIGGSVALTVLHARLAGRLDGDSIAILRSQSARLGGLLFGPAAITTLLAGIGMVAVSGMGGQLWVTWGLIVVFASLVLSGGFIRRVAGRLTTLVTSPQSDAAVIDSYRTRLGMLNAFNLLLLLSAVWAMVVKPV